MDVRTSDSGTTWSSASSLQQVQHGQDRDRNRKQGRGQVTEVREDQDQNRKLSGQSMQAPRLRASPGEEGGVVGVGDGEPSLERGIPSIISLSPINVIPIIPIGGMMMK